MTDYVSLLNQRLQTLGWLNPAAVLWESNRSSIGADHTPMWSLTVRGRAHTRAHTCPNAHAHPSVHARATQCVQLCIRGTTLEATGMGTNVREAKKDAAKQLYRLLQEKGADVPRASAVGRAMSSVDSLPDTDEEPVLPQTDSSAARYHEAFSASSAGWEASPASRSMFPGTSHTSITRHDPIAAAPHAGSTWPSLSADPAFATLHAGGFGDRMTGAATSVPVSSASRVSGGGTWPTLTSTPAGAPFPRSVLPSGALPVASDVDYTLIAQACEQWMRLTHIEARQHAPLGGAHPPLTRPTVPVRCR